jgi:hypothetical protein
VFRLQPGELQSVKDGLLVNPNNIGVGILHQPTGQIRMAPYDDLLGGHDALTARCSLDNQECKGFVVVLRPDGQFDCVNNSHLNGAQGKPASLQMETALFQEIVNTLRTGGL